uniref:PH domain-containing protein n=1 Tax=Lutzomyia longipalpis TaxID=7200 RepID=A0A1B0CWN1_LUTLO
MRFNKLELATLATQPSNKFEKEGLVWFTDREGFFRRTEVSTERWCRLRGNLLFYFKTSDQFSEPQGVIVLEKCKATIYSDSRESDGFVFYIEFDDGVTQRIATNSEAERLEWTQAIQMASYGELRKQLQVLMEKIERKRGNTHDLDVDMLRLQNGREIEIINPQFMCTITFRASDGLNSSSQIRFTAYDVREKVSQTAVPLGTAEIALGVIQDTSRLRIPFRSNSGNAGFITILSWSPDQDKKPSTSRSPAKAAEHQTMGHRRSQSLPPKLGVKLFVPPQGRLSLIYTNPIIHTYRLQSGLGGDITVHEMMLESQLCFLIPQQLLSIWILREKELLQEISGMGELGGEWRNKQMELLDKHLRLLKDYSQAKQNLQQCAGKYFKPSSHKDDESLEFAPVNLHLQRLWAHNETLKRSGVLDIVTVGAFTRHSGKTKTGGLIKQLQQLKQSPSKMEQLQNGCKVQAANDAVQAIKQLRKEIVEIMSQLLMLAKSKNPKGMLPLCNEMMTKTRSLLTLWEPSLVEEAFEFIERHRIIDDATDNTLTPLSPFKKITQQLGALDLKSPDLEDFATPMGPAPDLWPRSASKSMKTPTGTLKGKSPSATDLNTLSTILVEAAASSKKDAQTEAEILSCSLPVTCNMDTEMKFNETHFDVNGEISTIDSSAAVRNSTEDTTSNVTQMESFDENGYALDNPAIVLGHNGAFLDMKVMSSSPSANYYRPTEEPEPLDLTQLNIEASVMCLVSKVKFLCGRCGSPAVRLRQPKSVIKRTGFTVTPPDVVTSQPGLQNVQHEAAAPATAESSNQPTLNKSANLCGKDLNLALTQAIGEVTRKVKKGNKFTDGLDLSMTTDWTSELRPSMRKLRQAMDGLLKTARLIHSLTALVSGLMGKLWGTQITENFIQLMCNLGPLAYFEGLLSLYGSETDMWGDMCVAIEDLSSVRFTLIRSNIQRDTKLLPFPRIVGSRQSLTVLLPVPEIVYCALPTKETPSFRVTPVFFNIGINEKATLSETLRYTTEQHRSNWDNFDRLKQYHIRYKKLNLTVPETPTKSEPHVPTQTVVNLLNTMEDQLKLNPSKNVKILSLAEDITRALHGVQFTSCKSAKDRTAMAVTLQQCRILQQEFHLPATSMQIVMDTMRR